jgi:hypothetical protein
LLATVGTASAAGQPGIDEGTARKAIAMCDRISAHLVGLDLRAPVTSATSAAVHCAHDDGSTVELSLDLPQPAAPRGRAAAANAHAATSAGKPQPAASGGIVLRQADVDAGYKSDATSQACYLRFPGAQPVALKVDDGGQSGTILCRKVDLNGTDPRPITEFTIPFTISG